MDDGGGAVLAWQVLSAAHQLGLRPARTLRLVMWSCEEFGGIGAQQYFDRHSDTLGPLLSLAMESDMVPHSWRARHDCLFVSLLVICHD